MRRPPASPDAPPHAAAPDTAAAGEADPAGFAPVPLRARSDGWTPERQERFIASLAETGSVTKAARDVGMAPEGAYRLRHRAGGAAFDQAWEAALAVATRRLVDVAFERAIDGVETPVFHDGEIVGTRRTVSDRLLMFLLRHHDPLVYGDLAKPLPYDATLADVRGPRIRGFPALLARLLGGGGAKRDAEGRPSSARPS